MELRLALVLLGRTSVQEILTVETLKVPTNSCHPTLSRQDTFITTIIIIVAAIVTARSRTLVRDRRRQHAAC
jgi:hypothetical protein